MAKKSSSSIRREYQGLAESWINEAVRDTNYRLPEIEKDYSVLENASPEDLAAILLSIESIDRDKIPAALLPPRLPLDVSPLRALSSVDGIRETCEAIMDGAKPAHPAVIHSILSHALNFEEDGERFAAIASMQSLFKGQKASIRNSFYQPTIFQVSLLHPEWFTADKNIRPTIRGGMAPKESHHGMTTSLTLVRNRLRVNPAILLTHPSVVKTSNALFTESAESWANTVEEGFSGPNPLATSVWAMGLGNKEMFWDWMPPGAAMFSPFYSNGEVDALFANAVSNTKPGYYVRLGAGIADIFPFKDDALLGSQVNVTPLLDAPMSYGTLLSIHNLLSHPGSPVTITDAWLKMQNERLIVARGLDMIPEYSAFYDKKSPSSKSIQTMIQKGVSMEEFQSMLRNISQHQKDANISGVDVGVSISFVSKWFDYGMKLERNNETLAVGRSDPIIPVTENMQII